MPSTQSLKHLAVIMDGNGRWAHKHKHNRAFGHIKGAQTTRQIIQYCADLKIPYLSLFALSTENMQRPQTELKVLKKILTKSFSKQASLLKTKQIRLHILGDLSIFSEYLQKLSRQLCEETKNHQGLNLILALNYGGRLEILQALQKAISEIEQGRMKPEDLNENAFSSLLNSSRFPPPDLIIRTGGQIRLSNFYLWSSAYSELYFTPTLWPDFNSSGLDQALKKFNTTNRRFGQL